MPFRSKCQSPDLEVYFINEKKLIFLSKEHSGWPKIRIQGWVIYPMA
jgi:hypothetical protein